MNAVIGVNEYSNFLNIVVYTKMYSLNNSNSNYKIVHKSLLINCSPFFNRLNNIGNWYKDA